MSLFKLSAYFVSFFFLRQRESSNPESIQTDPLQIFLEAVENCKPVVGVISVERGGRAFQVRSVLRSRLCVVCALSCDLFSFYVHVYSQTDGPDGRTDRQTQMGTLAQQQRVLHYFKFFFSVLYFFQVPSPLPPQRRRFLAIKWLITAAREQQKTNKNARMYKKLAKELLNAYHNEVRTELFSPFQHFSKSIGCRMARFRRIGPSLTQHCGQQ